MIFHIFQIIFSFNSYPIGMDKICRRAFPGRILQKMGQFLYSLFYNVTNSVPDIAQFSKIRLMAPQIVGKNVHSRHNVRNFVRIFFETFSHT